MTNHETVEFLRAHDNYLIINHCRPDGDAVGSAAALCMGLQGLGKEAVIWKNPQTTRRYFPFLEGLETENVPEYATLVSVDLATEGLLPLNGGQFAGKIELSIDHHISNEGYAKHTMWRPSAPPAASCCWRFSRSWGRSAMRWRTPCTWPSPRIRAVCAIPT